MAAVQHRATTRTSNTDNSTTKTKSKATSARKSPATKRKRVSAETARAAAALKGLAVEAPAPSIEANEPGQFGRINVMDITPAEERGIFPARVELGERSSKAVPRWVPPPSCATRAARKPCARP